MQVVLMHEAMQEGRDLPTLLELYEFMALRVHERRRAYQHDKERMANLVNMLYYRGQEIPLERLRDKW
jgi:hypothetical protein